MCYTHNGFVYVCFALIIWTNAHTPDARPFDTRSPAKWFMFAFGAYVILILCPCPYWAPAVRIPTNLFYAHFNILKYSTIDEISQRLPYAIKTAFSGIIVSNRKHKVVNELDVYMYVKFNKQRPPTHSQWLILYLHGEALWTDCLTIQMCKWVIQFRYSWLHQMYLHSAYQFWIIIQSYALYSLPA